MFAAPRILTTAEINALNAAELEAYIDSLAVAWFEYKQAGDIVNYQRYLDATREPNARLTEIARGGVVVAEVIDAGISPIEAAMSNVGDFFDGVKQKITNAGTGAVVGGALLLLALYAIKDK